MLLSTSVSLHQLDMLDSGVQVGRAMQGGRGEGDPV